MRHALSSRLAVSAVGLLLLAAPAFAQSDAPPAHHGKAASSAKVSPEKLALARTVIQSTGVMRSFDPVLNEILGQARRTVLATNPDVEKDLDASLADLQKELAPRQQELNDDIAKLYATHFSDADLTQLVQFYQSPIGKKLVTVTPIILRDSYSVVQNWAQELSVSVMEKLRAEMKKKGHDI